MGVWRVYGGRGFTALGDLVPHKHTVLTVSSVDKEFFLRDDDVVFPGLADFHVHLRGNQNTLGIPPAVLTSSGVFLVADAGTHGWMHWTLPPTPDPIPFRKYWIALLPHGLDSYPVSPKFGGLTEADDVQLRDLFHSNPQIMGLKIRLGQHDAGEDRALLREGIKQARANQVGLMIHLTDTYLSWQEILEPLIAGDVLTHVFHGRRGSLLKDPDAVSLLGKAQDRGVILDVGHGANHFAWEAFLMALAEGITALVPNDYGLQRAIRAGVTTITLVVSASESHNQKNLNRSRADSLALLTIVTARAHDAGLRVRGPISTAFDCPFEGRVRLSSVMTVAETYLAMGVDQIGLADTLGTAHPALVKERILALSSPVRSRPLGATSA